MPAAIHLKGIAIDDTFAEAFGMSATGVIVTADTAKWALIAAQTMTGFGTSVIGCGVEAGIDAILPEEKTPDGRPGARVLLFGFSPEALAPQLVSRVGQCVLTSPGSACFAGLDSDARLPLGAQLRFFGDGWQISKRFGGKRYWRIPVMDGEFLCEDSTGVTSKAVGGGNLIVMGRDRTGLLEVCERAVDAIGEVSGGIAPFPGGIVRSGSKVGSKYKALVASTNHLFCPTLRGAVDSALDLDSTGALEIVIDGLTSNDVANAMRAGIDAILRDGAAHGVTRITAGNYGGNLGPHHFHLKDMLP